MRIISLLLLLASPASAQPTDLFLLIGQSNMAGRGIVEPRDTAQLPGIYTLTKEKKWAAAVDPIHFDRPDRTGVGLGRTFAATLIEYKAAASVGLIPAAFGGSSLAEWAPGTPHFSNAVERVKAALALSPSSKLRGILWHQGEADSADAGLAASYRARFATMIAALRREVGDVPVVVGELGEFLYSRPNLPDPYAWMVNEQLALVPFTVPRSGFVSSQGLTHKGDVLHFDAPSLREFGRRYALAWLALTGPQEAQRTSASKSK